MMKIELSSRKIYLGKSQNRLETSLFIYSKIFSILPERGMCSFEVLPKFILTIQTENGSQWLECFYLASSI